MENADYFRLQNIDDTERFVSDEKFSGNKRFTLLQLREQGVRFEHVKDFQMHPFDHKSFHSAMQKN